MLLRPSSATADAQTVLLRAASGGPDANSPELLVRASDKPEGRIAEDASKRVG
jgi:hypothetical protein